MKLNLTAVILFMLVACGGEKRKDLEKTMTQLAGKKNHRFF